MSEYEWDDFGNIIDDEEVIDKRDFLDENGVNIFTKKSEDKTVEERIKTSRTLKIKHNKWNQIDYTEDFGDKKITIEPQYTKSSDSYEDIEFERITHDLIKKSKYNTLLFEDENPSLTYQTINDIILYLYGKLRNEYSLTRIFVFVCEYCGVGLASMFKRISSYLQMQILTELKEISNTPDELLDNDIKLF